MGGHGNVGEHGGVDGRLGNGYAKVGGGDEGGAGGKRGLGHVRPTARQRSDSWMDFQNKVPAVAC